MARLSQIFANQAAQLIEKFADRGVMLPIAINTAFSPIVLCSGSATLCPAATQLLGLEPHLQATSLEQLSSCLNHEDNVPVDLIPEIDSTVILLNDGTLKSVEDEPVVSELLPKLAPYDSILSEILEKPQITQIVTQQPTLPQRDGGTSTVWDTERSLAPEDLEAAKTPLFRLAALIPSYTDDPSIQGLVRALQWELSAVLVYVGDGEEDQDLFHSLSLLLHQLSSTDPDIISTAVLDITSDDRLLAYVNETVGEQLNNTLAALSQQWFQESPLMIAPETTAIEVRSSVGFWANVSSVPLLGFVPRCVMNVARWNRYRQMTDLDLLNRSLQGDVRAAREIVHRIHHIEAYYISKEREMNAPYLEGHRVTKYIKRIVLEGSHDDVREEIVRDLISVADNSLSPPSMPSVVTFAILSIGFYGFEDPTDWVAQRRGLLALALLRLFHEMHPEWDIIGKIFALGNNKLSWFRIMCSDKNLSSIYNYYEGSNMWSSIFKEDDAINCLRIGLELVRGAEHIDNVNYRAKLLLCVANRIKDRYPDTYQAYIEQLKILAQNSLVHEALGKIDPETFPPQ
jgi:hypothetical protein